MLLPRWTTILLALPLTITRECWAKRGPIRDAIENGLAADYSREECVWRRENDRDLCPDQYVRVYLYTPSPPSNLTEPPRRLLLDHALRTDWLRQDYDPAKDNVLLIHGYAGNSATSRERERERTNDNGGIFSKELFKTESHC